MNEQTNERIPIGFGDFIHDLTHCQGDVTSPSYQLNRFVLAISATSTIFW